jgi:hypothetical protein
MAAYLDDVTLIGPHEELRRALDILREAEPLTGLHLNLRKCELWWPKLPPDIEATYPATLQVHRATGVELLGCPLGGEEFAEALVGKRVEKIRQCLSRLHRLQDPQIELALLRSCMGMPKFNFCLRTCSPSHIQRAIKAFDECISESLVRLLGGPGCTQAALTQAQLPASLGGLGLPTAASRAGPAFIASKVQTLVSQHALLTPPGGTPPPPDTAEDLRPDFLPALDAFQAAYPDPSLLSLSALVAETKPQQVMSARVDQAALKALQAATRTVPELARLRDLQAPFAGSLATVPPNRALGFRLRPMEFRLSIRYRLGLPLADRPRPCPLCPGTLDIYGVHAASCKAYPGISTRHNAVRDATLEAAKKAKFAAESETLHLLDHSPDTLGRRPADVLVHGWEGEKAMCLDVSVVNPLTASAIDRWPASAVVFAEDAKIKASEALCAQSGLLFLAVVMGTYGGLGLKAKVALNRIGKALAAASEEGGDEGRAVHTLGTKISFACQKGLARSLHARYTSLHPQAPMPSCATGCWVRETRTRTSLDEC